MCELLAMSARLPTALGISFDELARHGGGTGPHCDGWGIALWQDGDALVIREPGAASGSQWVQFIHEQQPRSTIAIAHVRKATQGPRSLRNTQPFERKLAGRVHLFAHNGVLPGIEDHTRFRTRRFRRVGDTDSEQAFCALLERLAPLWEEGVPSMDDRSFAVRSFASDLRALGPANFIYTDGDVIFAHGHRRTQGGGDIRPPGLHMLCRTGTTTTNAPPLAGVAIEPTDHEVALVASVPLSTEHWEPLVEGEIIVLREGRMVRRISVGTP